MDNKPVGKNDTDKHPKIMDIGKWRAEHPSRILHANGDNKVSQATNKAGGATIIAPNKFKKPYQVADYLNDTLASKDDDCQVVAEGEIIRGRYKDFRFDMEFCPGKSITLYISPKAYYKEDYEIYEELISAINPLMWTKHPKCKCNKVGCGPLLVYDVYSCSQGEYDPYEDEGGSYIIWDVYDPERAIKRLVYKQLNNMDDVRDVRLLQPQFDIENYKNDCCYWFGNVDFYYSTQFVENIKNISQTELYLHLVYTSIYLTRVREEIERLKIIGYFGQQYDCACNSELRGMHCMAWLWQQTQNFGIKARQPNDKELPALTKKQQQWFKKVDGVYNTAMARLGKGVNCGNLLDLEGKSYTLVTIQEPIEDLTEEEKQIKTYKQFIAYIDEQLANQEELGKQP